MPYTASLKSTAEWLLQDMNFKCQLGLEVEFQVPRSEITINLDLAQITHASSGEITEPISDWKIVREGGFYEYVSPILNSSNAGDILSVCQQLNEVLSAFVTQLCGLHVHVGILESALESGQTLKSRTGSDFSLNLIKQLIINHMLLEREGFGFPAREMLISSFKTRMLEHQRFRNWGTCNTFSLAAALVEIAEAKSLVSLIKIVQPIGRYACRYDNAPLANTAYEKDYSLLMDHNLSRRNAKLNLNALFKHGTIEFREHSGTINSLDIASWMKCIDSLVSLSIKMVKQANKARIPDLNDFLVLQAIHRKLRSNNKFIIQEIKQFERGAIFYKKLLPLDCENLSRFANQREELLSHIRHLTPKDCSYLLLFCAARTKHRQLASQLLLMHDIDRNLPAPAGPEKGLTFWYYFIQEESCYLSIKHKKTKKVLREVKKITEVLGEVYAQIKKLEKQRGKTKSSWFSFFQTDKQSILRQKLRLLTRLNTKLRKNFQSQNINGLIDTLHKTRNMSAFLFYEQSTRVMLNNGYQKMICIKKNLALLQSLGECSANCVTSFSQASI